MGKGNFSDAIEIAYCEATDQYRVLKTIWFTRPNGEPIPIPEGLYTDFASTGNIPGFPKTGPYNRAAALHDFLYQGEFFPRKLADTIFGEALQCCLRVPDWKEPLMVAAVRLFGWLTYNKHTEASVKYARRLMMVSGKARPLWKDGVAHWV